MAAGIATTEDVDIYPGGDVVLVCAPSDGKQLKLRVSSAVLTMASPVFKAMLSLLFKEGNTLATKSSVEIPLPDDDSIAMSTVCALLHMRQDLTSTTVSSEFLWDLVVVCDKYGMTGKMGEKVRRWCNPNGLSYRNSLELLPVAIAFDLSDEVAKLGRQIIKTATGEIEAAQTSPRSRAFDLALRQLIARRTSLAKALRDAIEDQLAEIAQAIRADGRDRDALLDFVAALQWQALWPSRKLEEGSIGLVFQKAVDLRVGGHSGDEDDGWSLMLCAQMMVYTIRREMDRLEELAWSSESDGEGRLIGFH